MFLIGVRLKGIDTSMQGMLKMSAESSTSQLCISRDHFFAHYYCMQPWAEPLMSWWEAVRNKRLNHAYHVLTHQTRESLMLVIIHNRSQLASCEAVLLLFTCVAGNCISSL